MFFFNYFDFFNFTCLFKTFKWSADFGFDFSSTFSETFSSESVWTMSTPLDKPFLGISLLVKKNIYSETRL